MDGCKIRCCASRRLFEIREEFNKIPTNPGLKLIRDFPPQECPSKIMCTQKTGAIDVYEVMAEPVEPEIGN